ncbi:transglutaminase-like putative cysteine protease [Hydrogenivirga caldilitoris]|uniref:Transglutaminase-like putative cysteine protease n=1 Tax=Hydrogenivirga caldilitoris TaxID=246264 RepID=A0A497XNQ4_9AQUI|nr:transglutaminase family protein [Hydrogenivirga caldilitoris]RLJ70596.1 transglutaminase-like putative cysteine protease [Hydrogenivirga caldilitoris]
MRYKVIYNTDNHYTDVVREAIYDLLVLPTTDESQTLLFYNTENSIKEKPTLYKNTFGFDVFRIRTAKPFETFSFRMEAEVAVKEVNPFDFISLPPEEERAILNSEAFKIDNFLFLKRTRYTHLSDSNKKKIPNLDKSKSVFNFLLELNRYINERIDYCTLSTDVYTTADQVFELGKGVCQDYAHAFISVARENQIPSRYVSGYLNPGEGLIGSLFMHAWVEALIPGVGWKGFDPTNNLLVDENYVKVAHGVDYNDCAPIKGVVKTNGKVETQYLVQVSQEQQ